MMISQSNLPVSLVLDCGATNIRAIAIDTKGRILHMEALPNAAIAQFKNRPWLIWDHETIWKNLIKCAGKTVKIIGKNRIAAIAVTSFSDDGAPVDEKGHLLYPVISWRCIRTEETAEELNKIIALEDIYKITGQMPFPQHTILRLLWLKKHAPEKLQKAYKYLMFPGLITFRLTGEFINDPTTADSMMLLDLKKRSYSKKLLNLIGLHEGFFGRLCEPGEIAGILRSKIASEIGLPDGIPVVVAGHDTQFAVFGSGAKPGEMVLSSGTWEILMLRSLKPRTDKKAFASGLNNECDPIKGIYNAGLQWIGSGAVEWLSKLIYNESTGKSIYFRMIADAEKTEAGAGGVMILPSFFSGKGIFGGSLTGAKFSGLNLQAGHGELVRALYEGLSFQLRSAIEKIKSLFNITPEFLTVVGGGSRNSLWNSIRSDVTGLPIRLTSQTENTALGAAIFSFIGAGVYRTVEEATENINFFEKTIEPSSNRKAYDNLYDKFSCMIKKNSSI